MKKFLALLLAMAMCLSMAACSTGQGGENSPPADSPSPSAQQPSDTPSETPDQPSAATEITLWTFPIGNWGDDATVQGMLADFEAATSIKVNVEYMDYTNGDNTVNTALAAGEGPDLIMEGPERLISVWGLAGYMADLSDLVDDEDKSQIRPAALDPCYAENGELYEYPLVMVAHSMAINKTVFEAAGAMQYINEDTHTWKSTEDFLKAVQAVYDHTGTPVGAVYCSGQGGDQGTRAIINNMYGGAWVNADGTHPWNSEANVKAMQALYDAEGIEYDASLNGGQEITAFYQGLLNMAFCWNAAQQLNPNSAGTGEGKTLNGDEIMYLSFPTEDGSAASLNGGIWGFGIFDNGDEKKIAAAKEFIKFMCDSEYTAEAVKAANYFPVRDVAGGVDISGVWDDNPTMKEYNSLIVPHLGDYFQVSKNYAAARFQWWNMLQAIGTGADVAESAASHAADADAGVGE